MHLIQDENGNLCPHTHEHEHTHQHTYEHSHPHSHEHGHEEEHNHSHDEAGCTSCGHTHGDESCGGCGHSHEEPQGDRLTALIDYMLKHNEHHAAELDGVAAKLREAGRDDAAEQIRKAVDEFQKGNMYLGLALSLVKGQ